MECSPSPCGVKPEGHQLDTMLHSRCGRTSHLALLPPQPAAITQHRHKPCQDVGARYTRAIGSPRPSNSLLPRHQLWPLCPPRPWPDRPYCQPLPLPLVSHRQIASWLAPLLRPPALGRVEGGPTGPLGRPPLPRRRTGSQALSGSCVSLASSVAPAKPSGTPSGSKSYTGRARELEDS